MSFEQLSKISNKNEAHFFSEVVELPKDFVAPCLFLKGDDVVAIVGDVSNMLNAFYKNKNAIVASNKNLKTFLTRYFKEKKWQILEIEKNGASNSDSEHAALRISGVQKRGRKVRG